MYTYKDFVTGKTKRTRGSFAYWSKRTGPLNVRYAIFQNPRGQVCVPHYCLTKETRERIPPMPKGEISTDTRHIDDVCPKCNETKADWRKMCVNCAG